MSDVDELALALGQNMRRQGARMAVAESCTGGLVAGALTEVAGSSDWFEGGVVAYDNRVKTGLLSVPAALLAEHGAVSQACVEAMVRGVCRLLDVSVGLAVSGIAGPTGGTPGKPVGTVWMAWEVGGRVWSRRYVFSGTRRDVRLQSVRAALAGLLGHEKRRLQWETPQKREG